MAISASLNMSVIIGFDQWNVRGSNQSYFPVEVLRPSVSFAMLLSSSAPVSGNNSEDVCCIGLGPGQSPSMNGRCSLGNEQTFTV